MPQGEAEVTATVTVSKIFWEADDGDTDAEIERELREDFARHALTSNVGDIAEVDVKSVKLNKE